MRSVKKQVTSRRSSDSNGGTDAGREVWSLLFRLIQDEKAAVLSVWAEFEVSAAQAYLLDRLEPNVPLPMIGLAEALGCLPSNVTGLVDKLEQRGLVQRVSNAQDRRVKMITLTPEGLRFRVRLLDRLSDPPRFIAALSKADKKALLQILQRAPRSARQTPRAGEACF